MLIFVEIVDYAKITFGSSVCHTAKFGDILNHGQAATVWRKSENIWIVGEDFQYGSFDLWTLTFWGQKFKVEAHSVLKSALNSTWQKHTILDVLRWIKSFLLFMVLIDYNAFPVHSGADLL